MSNPFLIRLRKERGFSQAKLGQKVFEKLETGSTPIYAQKKISLWESGSSKPSTDELRALSDILNVSFDELHSSFDDKSQEAVDIFERIAKSEHPSIMAVCHSGLPRGPHSLPVFNIIQTALNNNLCYAMVVPYPAKLNIELPAAVSATLQGYYSSVLGQVTDYRDALRRGIEDENKIENVSVFVPSAEMSDIIIPPFFSRYTLIIQAVNGNFEDTHLYLWVETAEISALQEVAAFDASSRANQIGPWIAYFQPILSAWRKYRKLPKEAFKTVPDSSWKLYDD